MAVPRDRIEWAQRVEVAVETSAGSGAFAVDDRLRADVVELLSDGRLGTAGVSVRTDDAFGPAEAAAEYHPDRRMIVRTKDAVLFDGYPVRAGLNWADGVGAPGLGRGVGELGGRSSRNTGAADRGAEYRLTLEHAVGRLARDPRAQIFGRQVRDGVILDGLATDPQAWASASVLASGLPCVFSPEGAANCDPTPLQVSSGDGGTRAVHIFTDDAPPDAVPWTYARILRYLLHFYVWRDCPIGAARVFELTDAASALPSAGREVYLDADPLRYALLGQPRSLAIEAASLLKAIALLTTGSGLHLTPESVTAGQGVRTQWRLWSDLGGPRRETHLATNRRDAAGQPVYDPSAMPAADLFADNNVSAATVAWDARTIGETAIVIGGVKHYEIRAELLPGWLPEADLDNVPEEQRESAKAKALTEVGVRSAGEEVVENEWYRAYHRGGAAFAGHWRVGRLWVLNEAGDYRPAEYDRNPPFDSYAPYGFAPALPGRWMRRRRRLLPIGATPGGQGVVALEISFDDGESWMTLESDYEVLTDECGIWLSAPNLLSIAPPGRQEEVNLWYALIDQRCRLRVTALVESDERLVVEKAAATAPTTLRSATVRYAPRRYRFVRRRQDESDGPWVLEADAAVQRDDTAAMERAASALAQARAGREVGGRVVIPWLDASYAVGDRIAGIRGRAIGFAGERPPSERFACVVGKRYRLGPDRLETELLLASATDERQMTNDE
jgi:hypothetical protein